MARPPASPQDAEESQKRAWRLFGGTLTLLLLSVIVLTVRQQRHPRSPFGAEESQAQALALSYDAVQLAPKSFWNQPVLWRLGCRNYRDTTCYYEGDLDKQVVFPDGTQLPYDGHKGMSFCLTLARIQRAEPGKVYLELLEARGTRE